mmetsp:Transcript_36741/g.73219  ORF Transcript_36741/g.73219 Transcript_36741/m.73219 type:complete len:299 (+) Transcript_36741:335-1231(+)
MPLRQGASYQGRYRRACRPLAQHRSGSPPTRSRPTSGSASPNQAPAPMRSGGPTLFGRTLGPARPSPTTKGAQASTRPPCASRPCRRRANRDRARTTSATSRLSWLRCSAALMAATASSVRRRADSTRSSRTMCQALVRMTRWPQGRAKASATRGSRPLLLRACSASPSPRRRACRTRWWRAGRRTRCRHRGSITPVQTTRGKSHWRTRHLPPGPTTPSCRPSSDSQLVSWAVACGCPTCPGRANTCPSTQRRASASSRPRPCASAARRDALGPRSVASSQAPRPRPVQASTSPTSRS